MTSSNAADTSCSRREALKGGALLAAALTLSTAAEPAHALPASKGALPDVGRYLPAAGVEDFVEFIPPKGKTPAIRAGNIDMSEPYRFAVPPTWREGKIANIQSGNFCLPRCDEPWTEALYENPAEGKLTLIVSPLRRLISKTNATIRDVGPPETVLGSVGAFITGTSPPDDEDVERKEVREVDGRTYYMYELHASDSIDKPHSVSTITTKGDLAFLFIASATDKQWARSAPKLRKVVETFRA
ncbi:hypothetical protein WJX81_007290 [Elliptochloris bilobata]|uniref:PsbP C-terminal domain-containing protein n=1 Tax=Elliptochloris bilobata TaxID=381761 RepID=A0AAW1REC9_9CHLO